MTDLKNVKLSVSGKDIEVYGLTPSPVYGKILSMVLDAKLNGEVKTHDDELRVLKKYVAKF